MNAAPAAPGLIQRRFRRYGLFVRGALLFVAAALATPGCGYMVGNAYAPQIRTVHVPTFTSEGFRRGYELQLTEAVQRQIQMRTPFRLSKAYDADTRLVGRIISIDKRVANQNRYDDPRELEFAIAIEVRWEDARTGQLLQSREFPLDAPTEQLLARTTFAPETGQSLATATDETTEQLARQIVGMMETPW
ncbi:MAG: hypothetical protein DWQ34_15985 [Planctomycetota bacterium]|nr:MAG: hypothetical protein DWQ34_15985 [Planctomycetota bacterium]REK31016.1 MAG: hypothetical protein DWQ41_00910 [Planctomycetota bacterium]REK36867.1 MAG: hypothetical protein DWQ45_09695 [Planctomycetota bacterium]